VASAPPTLSSCSAGAAVRVRVRVRVRVWVRVRVRVRVTGVVLCGSRCCADSGGIGGALTGGRGGGGGDVGSAGLGGLGGLGDGSGGLGGGVGISSHLHDRRRRCGLLGRCGGGLVRVRIRAG